MTLSVRRDNPRTVVFAFLDLNDGGAQRLTLHACRHLDRDRYRPVILCARGGGALVEEARASGVPVVELGRLQHRYDIGAIPVIAKRLRYLRASIVHVPLYSRSSPYVRLAAGLARVPLVVAHEWCRPTVATGLRRWTDRALAPASRFAAASAAQARELVAEGVDPAAIEVVYSGIDASRFSPRDRAASRRILGLGDGRLVMLVPARLHPMKGHVDLLAAIVHLQRSRSDVLVWVAGDGPLRAVLPALAAAAGLEQTVRFLGQRADMPTLYGACDVVCLPSHIEGLPSVVMEALAAKRAVVATAVGGVPEIVIDGETGWLVEPRQPERLAHALADALAHPAERAARASRGHELVLERFQAATAARRLQDVYDGWLGWDAPSPARPRSKAPADSFGVAP